MHLNCTKYLRKRSLSVPFRLLFSLLVLTLAIEAPAQKKSTKKINIQNADLLLYQESIVKSVQRLIGNVVLSHKNMILKCDSAWAYSTSNSVDAYGNVHIISGDTLNMWADFVNYNGDNRLIKARRNVILKDSSVTLTSDSLDFDMLKEIGYYNYGGQIVDSTNTLTSTIGKYYTQKNELQFIDSVKLINGEYIIMADTMAYNTITEIIDFKGPTNITGDSTHVYSTGGWFNTQTNITELNKSSTIRRGDTQLQANYIYYNDNNGNGSAMGDVIINDFKNQLIIAGQKAIYDDFNEYAMVTDSAMWVQYYNKDSLFLHADTLYSMPDNSAQNAKMLITYNHVRFYRTDIQGIADSLIYYTKDSTIQLYNDPVLWSFKNQMAADFIEMKTHSTPPNEVFLKKNAFIIQELDSMKYNQISGKNMTGLINEKYLYQIDVDGNGQSIYYPADDKTYIGINKAESSSIVLHLDKNSINRITFVGAPLGSMKPMIEGISEETRLDGFIWRSKERPQNRYSIFETGKQEQTSDLMPDIKIKKILPAIENELEKANKNGLIKQTL